jgi:hypothetical protein
MDGAVLVTDDCFPHLIIVYKKHGKWREEKLLILHVLCHR